MQQHLLVRPKSGYFGLIAINSDRHGGTVLGFNAHLAIQFGIDLAKPPRMIAALARQAGGSAEATALPLLGTPPTQSS
jgi:hypothetical protein